MLNYASIALLEQIDDSNISIWKVSVSNDGAELSGAWVFNNQDFENNIGILADNLILEIKVSIPNSVLLNQFAVHKVNISDFLHEAISDAENGMAAFEGFVRENEKKYKEYMAVEASARKQLPKVQKKQLVSPEFKIWPKTLEFAQSKEFLEANGKAGLITNDKEYLSSNLASARAIQLLIQMWQFDEVERKNRIYMEDQSAEVTILPRCWLSKLAI
jgi:hypothetical protein